MLSMQVGEAVCLESLSYHEAWELSYFGASVLHPRTTMPAMKYSIPITIRNFFNRSAAGVHAPHDVQQLCHLLQLPHVRHLRHVCYPLVLLSPSGSAWELAMQLPVLRLASWVKRVTCGTVLVEPSSMKPLGLCMPDVPSDYLIHMRWCHKVLPVSRLQLLTSGHHSCHSSSSYIKALQHTSSRLPCK